MRVWAAIQVGTGQGFLEVMFLEQLVSLARKGDRRALARLLSSIENGETVLESEIDESDDWRILALTGPPGVGKSCLLDRLLHVWTNDGMKIGVLAVLSLIHI